MILYHASDVEGITKLRPQVANHQKAYIYLSTKKELIYVYLVNPVKNFCEKNNIEIESGHTCQRWALRSWDKEKGVPMLYEWWPNSFEDVYKGTKSFFYQVEANEDCQPLIAPEFPNNHSFYICPKPIAVKQVEVIDDTYEFLKQAEKEGKVVLRKYETLPSEFRRVIKENVLKGYQDATRLGKTHYQKFLESKFPDIISSTKNNTNENTQNVQNVRTK